MTPYEACFDSLNLFKTVAIANGLIPVLAIGIPLLVSSAIVFFVVRHFSRISQVGMEGYGGGKSINGDDWVSHMPANDFQTNLLMRSHTLSGLKSSLKEMDGQEWTDDDVKYLYGQG